MAEIATGALSSLLPKLGSLLAEEYKLQRRVRGDITFLKAELESMQSALIKVSEAPIDQPRDIQVILWARDVRDLSYDIEDGTDKFVVRLNTRSKHHGFMGFLNRSFSLLTKAKIRRSLALSIKDIKSLVREVSERRDRYKVDNIVANQIGTTIDTLRLSALYNKVAELVGTEDKSDDLVKRLMEGGKASKEQPKIVSIVGFGGLGKTTLANMVYEKLKVHFHCGAFVSVSLSPNMVKIFKNMLYQVNKGKHGNIINEPYWSEQQLIDELREFLKDKRYFIVIDDIWDYSVWKTIRHALIENGNGSKIITTTRNVDVANQIGGVYHIIPLSLDDSRKLFFQRIYGGEEKSPTAQLVKVSEIILKKCGGVPLAIITIASILASKRGMANSHDYWSKVSHCMGLGLEDNPQIQEMRRILSLSYYDLPPHLRTCLLYLCLFPEDHDITREYLIWKWVGEGFVHNQHGKSLYEVGEDYFDDLINRSMVKPVEFDGCSKATTCRVHDMVLDLISSLSNEEHFLTAVGGQQLKPLLSKIRRLSLQTGKAEHVRLLATISVTHVRSLIVFEQAFNLLPALSCFPVLRALDLSECEQVDNHLFMDICKLFHLRYLCLRRTSVTEVPKEIGNLQFLQVLDISLTEVKVLPSTFVQLTQLVYLNVSSWTRLPDGFGKLEALQNIPGITIRYPSMLHDLGKLTELRNLKIVKFDRRQVSGDDFDEPFLECLSNLVNLEKLEVNYYVGGPKFSLASSLSPGPQQVRSIDMLRTNLSSVPRWMSSLSFLSAVEITIRTLAVEDFQVLGSIPSLTDLYVWVLEPTGDRPERLAIDSRYPFRCLSLFRFWSYGMEVVFSQGAMPNLQTLDLDFQVRKTMDLYGNFNFGLENLPLLERVPVKIDCFSTELAEVEAAEAALRRGVDMNPNKPTLKLTKYDI